MNHFVLNPALNGIELYFDQKPEISILQALKDSKKWRWHKLKKCWYAKQCNETISTAKALVNDETPAQEALKPAGVQELKGVKIGDIYYSSWGYEQTNVDFYQVVAFKGKGTAVLREIRKEYIRSTGSMSGTVKAAKDEFAREKALEKRILDLGSPDRACFKISDRHYAYKWDGRELDYSSYA